MSAKASAEVFNMADSKRVYIVGTYKKPFIEMFLSRNGYVGTLSLSDADICLFTGGPDVDPKLYGQGSHKSTFTSDKRDEEDLLAYQNSSHCLRVGICRGAQFLNVMNGGKLWQHVDNHRSAHFMYDLQTQQKLWVTSTHHQQMIPGPEAYKVATCHLSETKESDTEVWRRRENPKTDSFRDDWEVLWYEDTNSLCFQPHPEALDATNELKSYFFQKMWTAYMIYRRNLLAKAV